MAGLSKILINLDTYDRILGLAEIFVIGNKLLQSVFSNTLIEHVRSFMI